MTVEVLELRHTVRAFRDVPLVVADKLRLSGKIDEVNRQYHLQLRLFTDVDVPVKRMMKLFLARNLRNYIILSGPDMPCVKSLLGYVGAEIMVYAQSIGINSWWVGDTYNYDKVASRADGQIVAGIIVVGYGKKQGNPHKSRPEKEISSYFGRKPLWFQEGVRAALLAPTPKNSQDFLISGKDNEVSIISSDKKWGEIVCGIIRYFFEVGINSINQDSAMMEDNIKIDIIDSYVSK